MINRQGHTSDQLSLMLLNATKLKKIKIKQIRFIFQEN